MRVARMSLVGPRPVPHAPDRVRDEQRKPRAQTGGDYTVSPVARAVLAAREEERGQRHDEEDLSVDREEPQRVLEPIVPRGEAVQMLIKGEVQEVTLATPHCNVLYRTDGPSHFRAPATPDPDVASLNEAAGRAGRAELGAGRRIRGAGRDRHPGAGPGASAAASRARRTACSGAAPRSGRYGVRLGGRHR